MRWLRAWVEVFGGGALRHYRHVKQGGQWEWIGRELVNAGAGKVFECSTCGHIEIT